MGHTMFYHQWTKQQQHHRLGLDSSREAKTQNEVSYQLNVHVHQYIVLRWYTEGRDVFESL